MGGMYENLLFLQSASAFVAGDPAWSVLWAEFESDSLIGDRNSVTGVAFWFDKSGRLAGIRATPVVTDTFASDDMFSSTISTGAKLNRLSLSVLLDGVASGVGMRAENFSLYNKLKIWFNLF